MDRAEYMAEQLQGLCEAINEINVTLEQIDRAIMTIRDVLWSSRAGADAIADLQRERARLLETKEGLMTLFEKPRNKSC
jgi:hypothetical protein